MALKYLFIAEYKDGTIYEQTPADVSISDAKRSCFFDVRQDDLSKFYLVSVDKVFSVDLNDGHFEVNHTPFFMHDSGEGLKDFRIIFFRQHTHKFNIGMQETAHDIEYLIGWQCNDKEGKNHKRIMQIN